MALKGYWQKIREWIGKHRLLTSFILLLCLFIFLVFGTQIVLMVNFLLGNDIIVRLASDKESIQINPGQSADVSFVASISTNPFCQATCNSVFEDISSNKTISTDEFVITASHPIEKTHRLSAPDYGAGQQLYRFSMQCVSQKSTLCHTSEEPTYRSVLITLNYDLSESDKKIAQELISDFNTLQEKFATLKSMYYYLSNNSKELNSKIVFESNLESIGNSLNEHDGDLQILKEFWKMQRIDEFENQFEELKSSIESSERALQQINNSMINIVAEHNNLVGQMQQASSTLSLLAGNFLTESISAEQINSTIEEYNDAALLLSSRSTIEQEKIAVTHIRNTILLLNESVRKQMLQQAINNTIQTDVRYMALCLEENDCRQIPAVNERAISQFNLKESCDYASTFNFSVSNASLAAEKYLANLSGRLKHSAEIKSLLADIDNSLSSCSPSQVLLANVEYSLSPLRFSNFSPSVVFDALEPVKPSCCVLGECKTCCLTCSNENYPVMLLHGHAINRDLASDYSLDSFKKLQLALESDGFIDAGAVSLYTDLNTPRGDWGLMHKPISVRASYYFDFFREPESYRIVQANSENIDTYAIRLKELIDKTKYKTGKDKVVLITHSMGGLVARRYIRIFGSSSLSSLIMIASPNHGIEGNIAQLCPYLGENLECRDMTKNSLFLNKLNSEQNFDMPVSNIIGTGCNMNGATGDGIVLQTSAYLEGAANIYINGSCKNLDVLHTAILNIDRYPKVYDVIRNRI